MSGRIDYAFPEDQEVIAKVVEAIPANWSWIDGGLLAPRSLYDEGRVAKNTCLKLSRFHSIRPTLVGEDHVSYEDDEWNRRRKETFLFPDLSGILFEGKLPSGVHFDEAGFDAKLFDTEKGGYVDFGITVALSKDFAARYIRLGYKGSILAYSGYENNHKFDNPEHLKIRYPDKPSSKGSFDYCPEGRIRIEWHSEHGGKKENLESIMETFETLGLRQTDWGFKDR